MIFAGAFFNENLVSERSNETGSAHLNIFILTSQQQTSGWLHFASMSLTSGAASERLASKAKSKKRPRDDESGSRKKRRKSGFEQDELLFDMETGVNKAIALMDTQLLADHIAQKTGRFNSEKTAVELADLYISRRYISSLTFWHETHNDTSKLNNRHDFVVGDTDSGKAS